ncbi:hypothetical protein GCM10027435_06490 [Haloparvum alkalitolerans]|uniref:DUF58 domain-containing protein n=1 Tax=Haloparvum alkalitolerans TaxID=1042953 RepID=UPI003CF3FFAF
MGALSDLRLTRRGRVVLAIVAVGFGMAALSGARSLNAVVLPGIVAVVAGAVQLSRLDAPSVRRRLPPDDFVGATHEVVLRFGDGDALREALDAPFVAAVRDDLGEGLDGPEAPTRATVGAEPVRYEVTYDARGDRTLGPVTLSATDVFGLLERDLLCRGTESVLVYPERRPVVGWFRRELYREDALGASRQRNEFDRLREYARGDALRDVNWAATAKRDDLIVNEFAAETDQRRVSIRGGARGDAADDLASAVASVALALLDDGVPVDVAVPNGRVSTDGGPDGRRRLLELLARTPRGAVPDADADVVIEADRTGTTVRVDDAETPFEALLPADGDAETAVTAAARSPDDAARPATDGGDPR